MKYKEKVQSQLCSGNAREACNGLNVIMGREGKKQNVPLNKSASFANGLNNFYSRFGNPPCSNNFNDNDNLDIFTNTTDHSIIVLTEAEVAVSLARIKPSKAPGPDGLRGRVVKLCRFQLTAVFTELFQR